LRISRKNRRPQPYQQRVVYPVNERIREPKVRVIDEEGVHLDVMTTADAIALAKERDLDLVVVQPKAEPPIAKITDFGKYKYEKEKAAKEQKSKARSVEVKGIRLSCRIGEHDIRVRMDKAKEFLEKGDKVKVEIILRGRERQLGAQATKVIQGFISRLNTEMPVKVEQPVLRQGGQLTSIVGRA
jgi:translation initiation factor IF-3